MKENPRDTLGYAIGLLARRWRQEVDAEVKSLGMTEATWRPLLHLSHLGDAVRQKDLAESMGIDTSSLVRLLDNLEERGLLRREDGPDRRTKLVCLTPAGRAAMEQARLVVTTLERDLLSGLDDAEVSQLSQLLGRVDTALKRARVKRS